MRHYLLFITECKHNPWKPKGHHLSEQQHGLLWQQPGTVLQMKLENSLLIQHVCLCADFERAKHSVAALHAKDLQTGHNNNASFRNWSLDPNCRPILPPAEPVLLQALLAYVSGTASTWTLRANFTHSSKPLLFFYKSRTRTIKNAQRQKLLWTRTPHRVHVQRILFIESFVRNLPTRFRRNVCSLVLVFQGYRSHHLDNI